MRATWIQFTCWAFLLVLLVAGNVEAATVSETYQEVTASLTGPDGVVAEGTAFDITSLAERDSYGYFRWWLYEDTTWSYTSSHGVVRTGGTLIDSDWWVTRSFDEQTFTITKPAGTYTYTLIVSNSFAHSSRGVAVDYVVTVGAATQDVHVDIHPTSCPNPLNVKGSGKGVVPVAVLGTADFDVTDIDPTTIELEGVSPSRWAVEDVTTPVADGDACECTTEGADGYDDLTLKFDRQAIIQAVGNVEDGDEIVLTLTGALDDGTAIEGSDCMVVRAAK
jgi:hypothetical protein